MSRKAPPDHRSAVARKCHPNRLKTSPELTAMLAYLLDEEWVSPTLINLREDKGGRLHAQAKGDLFAARDMDHADAFTLNLKGVAKACGLTNSERRWLYKLADTKIVKA